MFLEWLQRTPPTRYERVETRIRSTRGGRLNNTQWGRRMKGEGPLAEQIAATFRVFAARYGLNRERPPLDTSKFRRPPPTSGQLNLF
ncbi:MAG: hypothetical protein KY476_06280 [Planctomycetes bacterium]|nr:hypothetical protein [Planctomycetota bacterium]